MSAIPAPSSLPRRAVAVETSGPGLASARDSLLALRDRFQQTGAESNGRYAEIGIAEEAGINRNTLNTTLAALTVSALGLAVAGAVSMTSNAQAANPEAVLESQQQTNTAASVAQPAPVSSPDTSAGGGAANIPAGNAPQSGALEGRSADQTSRTAVRTELDAAMSAQLATQRSQLMSAANDTASEASRSQALASRSALLSAQVNQVKAGAQATPQGTLSVNAAKASTDAVVASSGGAATPLKSGTYTLGASFGAVGSWSRYHTGQDFPAPIGTPIYAAADGVVGPSNGGGWAGTHVVIDHSGGGATLYAHMSRKVVNPGAQVKAGQLIGYIGVTGRSFGPHLHWEYYPKASTVGDPYTTANPVTWLAARGVSI
ncbi:M23 family metallopeptidase [Raineyella fluvialis]|uniref:Peptidoglycan DD-metalloendopeptidase family protein n=1 Tax=Raineyella fluvialis TaxID=2662261 RepID=A0A5Q2FAX7_9ACTN|nr:M23 family metallopeptidase [Raineyella fluvialis]QGF22534.1 peptidoglycan DD-metalloendopeptidase family protein [Raineyella fluvialis]